MARLAGARAVFPRIHVQPDVSDLLLIVHTRRAYQSIPRYSPAHQEQPRLDGRRLP
ncbi:MAG: hypothetical protein HW390_736 [Candidatus Brocadiaceae bacterium]|nr:hypothetical protein [Candidatus Brocadiaceae bacterium]